MMKVSIVTGVALLVLASLMQPAEATPLPLMPNAVVGTGNMTEIYFRRGFYVAGGFYYYNGYRGVYGFRPGYRYYNGYWFPATAFVAASPGGTCAMVLRPLCVLSRMG